MWFCKKKQHRRGTISNTLEFKFYDKILEKRFVTIELEEIEKVGIYSRLRVISISGGIDKYLIQDQLFSGLFLSSKVNWIN